MHLRIPLQAYLRRSFGPQLDAARAALEALAGSIPAEEIGRRAYGAHRSQLAAAGPGQGGAAAEGRTWSFFPSRDHEVVSATPFPQICTRTSARPSAEGARGGASGAGLACSGCGTSRQSPLRDGGACVDSACCGRCWRLPECGRAATCRARRCSSASSRVQMLFLWCCFTRRTLAFAFTLLLRCRSCFRQRLH